jgi:2'-5' RNA ligase
MTDRATGESTLRLFVALSLPEPVRDALAALPESIRGVTWTRKEQLHVTLRFIGDTPSSALEAIRARLAAIDVATFVLPIEGVGTFPPNRPPRVIWAGTGTGHPRLFQLRQRLDDALLATGLPLDVRTFHPHVTLGRCAEDPGPALAKWLRTHGAFTAPPFRAAAFDLFASELKPMDAIHTLLERFPLR